MKTITLQSLLEPSAKARIDEDRQYQFCKSEDCPVVYFAEDGQSLFGKNELTVRVGIKEATAPRPVCYCFSHTIEEIEDNIRCTGDTRVLDDIRTHMKEACWCETKSPMGSCCLATVSNCVKAAKKQFGETHPTNAPAREAVAVADCCSGDSSSRTTA